MPTEKYKQFIKGEYTIIEEGAEIGEGTEIWNFCLIRKGSKIGKNCKIGSWVNIDRDVIIGDNCKIQDKCEIFKGVTIENNVFLGPGVTFTNVLKPDPYKIAAISTYKNTFIRDGSSIGAACVIICGADIKGKIAAGNVVLGNQYIRTNCSDWIKSANLIIKQYPKDK